MLNKSNTLTLFTRARKAIVIFTHSHPFVIALFGIFVYLIIFQRPFITHGDAWAESFAEYLDESIRYGWSEVFAQNWAGYFTIVPSFIAKLYVALGGPLGYIDYFYRFVVVVFTAFSTALVACKFNRSLIQNDWIRILLAVFLVAIIGDVASFSFINIWYIGFVPVILYCLNPIKLDNKIDIGMGVYGALIALTKPFIILLPFIIYRMVRARQYVGSSILLIATLIQSYQILFNDKRQIVEGADFGVHTTIAALFTGVTTAVYKLIGITPPAMWAILGALVMLIALFALLWKTKGIWVAIGLGLIFIYSVYTYVLAPDGGAFFGIDKFKDTFYYNAKTQRELLINASLVLALFFILDYLATRYKTIKIPRIHQHTRGIFISICLCLPLFILIYKPIDITSAGVTNAPLSKFRSQLNNEKPSCVPITPTTLFNSESNWSFAYRGTCATMTHDTNLFKPDFARMNTPIIRSQIHYDAEYFRLDKSQLQAIVVPVVNNSNHSHTLRLKDTSNDKTYTATAAPANTYKGPIQLVTFNVTGIKSQRDYNFVLESNENIRGSIFLHMNQLVTYPYFLNR